ncbi:uncharacterized protein LOC115210957 [Argonauta hians]
MAESDYDTPAYVTDEKSKPGFLEVTIKIPNLKPNKKFSSNAKNALVTPVFTKRSMCIIVKGNDGALVDKNYQLHIKKLPADIIDGDSYIKVENNRIKVFLAKAEPKSWYPMLNYGLETFEEEEDNNPEYTGS